MIVYETKQNIETWFLFEPGILIIIKPSPTNELLKATALLRWITIEMLWYKKAHSLGSPVTALKRAPSSLIRANPSELIGPTVSQATGQNICVEATVVYLAHLRTLANSAAAPPDCDDMARYDWAEVSGTVTSQVRHFPLLQGISVAPSGLLPSTRTRPWGSFDADYYLFFLPQVLRSLRIWKN